MPGPVWDKLFHRENSLSRDSSSRVLEWCLWKSWRQGEVVLFSISAAFHHSYMHHVPVCWLSLSLCSLSQQWYVFVDSLEQKVLLFLVNNEQNYYCCGAGWGPDHTGCITIRRECFWWSTSVLPLVGFCLLGWENQLITSCTDGPESWQPWPTELLSPPFRSWENKAITCMTQHLSEPGSVPVLLPSLIATENWGRDKAKICS